MCLGLRLWVSHFEFHAFDVSFSDPKNPLILLFKIFNLFHLICHVKSIPYL